MEKETNMLIRKMQFANLYDENAVEGTQQQAKPTPVTSQDKNEDKGEDVKLSLTQRELNRITAKEVKSAKEAANKAFLEDLGIDNLDTLKNLLKAKKEEDDSKKSEAQKLADELNKLKADLETERKAKAELELSRRKDKRDSELKSLLTSAHDANQVLILLQASKASEVDALVDENGAFDGEAAKKLVADYQKENAFLFKNTSPGSAISTRDGRAFSPDRDAKKEASERSFKNARNSV